MLVADFPSAALLLISVVQGGQTLKKQNYP